MGIKDRRVTLTQENPSGTPPSSQMIQDSVDVNLSQNSSSRGPGCSPVADGLKIFAHYLYEYRKGLRNLALYTGNREEIDVISNKLERENVSYHIQEINDTRTNVFFGDRACIGIIRQMKSRLLSNLTNEEDFILGIMLGYDRLRQCERYLKGKQRKTELL